MRPQLSVVPARTRRAAAAIAVAALLASLLALVAPASAATASVADTASTADTVDLVDSASMAALEAAVTAAPATTSFQAGNIIDDATFYKTGTMTEAQIQAFLVKMVPTCRSGYTCLRNFTQTTTDKPADAMCKGYTGGKNEPASRIIYKVSQSCGINAQVILVMLQKEQGLVTHTWPSDWRFDAALGQDCPDTPAGCSATYKGFFSQVYGGMWQMKRYTNPTGTSAYFTWYPVGKSSSVRYDVELSCGSAPVTIKNKATASLYYYTPYQPNKAALAAGYGEGDSCSAYGNRNFFNYFTDWFGSTYATPTTTSSPLVKVGTAVWLISGTQRYHVTSEAYAQYKAVFGAPKTVTSTVLNGYTDAGSASFYLVDESTGKFYYLADNKKHWFSSCTLVTTWGGSCSSGYITVTKAIAAKWSTGAQMTQFTTLSGSTQIAQATSSALRPVYDVATATAMNGGTAPYAPVMRASVAAKKKLSTMKVFAPGSFIRASGSSEVWFVDADTGRRYHLLNWAYAREMGLSASTSRVVSSSVLSTYTKSGDLGQFVTCNGKTYVASQGTMYTAATSGAATASVELGSANCGALTLKNSTSSRNGVFIRAVGTSAVYQLTGGTLRHVNSTAQWSALNGGVGYGGSIMVSAATLKTYPVGAAYPVPGTFVRQDGTSEVWFVDTTRLVHLPSWTMAAELGLKKSSTVVSAAALKGLTKADDALTQFISCSGSTRLIAGGGTVAIGSRSTGGNAVTELTAESCAKFTQRSGLSGKGFVFVTDGSRTAVATGGGFLVLKDEAAVSRAAEGTSPSRVTVSAATFASLPKATVPGEGAVVRSSTGTVVGIVSDGRRLRLPNWGVGADLGLQARYQILEAPALGNLPITDGVDLTPFVTCNGKTYVGSKGVLSPVSSSALGGITPVTLSSAACKTLDLSGKSISTTLLITDGSAYYTLSKGKLVSATSKTEGTKVVWDKRTIAGLR